MGTGRKSVAKSKPARKGKVKKPSAETRLRRAAARLGWERKRQKAEKRSEAAKRGWQTRRLRAERREIEWHGKNPSQRTVLRTMMRTKHPLFRDFLVKALEAGWDMKRIRDEWISPKRKRR